MLPIRQSAITTCIADGLRTYRTLLIALGASALVHLIATVGTPIWFHAWQRPETLQFNAILNPLAVPASVVEPVAASTAPQKKAARQRAPRPLPTPISEAAFAAPENAIAVERAAGDDIGTAAAGQANSDKTAAPSAAATTTPTVSETPAVAAETPATAAVPAPEVIAAPAVDLPSRFSIAYRATTSVADGVAHYRWTRDDTKYEFVSTIQAEGFFINMFAGTITQQSTGTVTPTGLEPAQFSIRRGDREAETVEFQRATKEIKLSRGGTSRVLPMPPNLQDTQSFLFQLAIEAVKLKTPDDRLNILVTNARGVNRYTFKKAGESTIDTRLGPVETVHLVRETSELRDSYEVWLSPKHHYLPVKLKFFVDRFPAELIATNITSTP